MPLGLVTELIAKPAVSAATGSRCEVNATAVLNPIVAAHEAANLAVMHTSNLNEGIWIGRRSFRWGGGGGGRRRGGGGGDEGRREREELRDENDKEEKGSLNGDGTEGDGGRNDEGKTAADAGADGSENDGAAAREEEDGGYDEVARRLFEGGAIVTIGPNLDYCHWSLVLDGTVYEMIPKGKKIRTFVRPDGVDKRRAQYTRVGKNMAIKESAESIERWRRDYEERNPEYHLTRNNCQRFVVELGKFATGREDFGVHVQVAMGNLLW